MTGTQIGSFLRDCIVTDEAADEGVTADEMYGLYVSWCRLGNVSIVGDDDFRSALAAQGIHPLGRGHGRIYAGMSMNGPSAIDYILNQRSRFRG